MEITTSENLATVKKWFGEPLGHLTDLIPGWKHKNYLVFWATETSWNGVSLFKLEDCSFRFKGPYQKEKVPFDVPSKGYLILVEE